MPNSLLSGYNPNPPTELASKPVAVVATDSNQTVSSDSTERTAAAPLSDFGVSLPDDSLEQVGVMHIDLGSNVTDITAELRPQGTLDAVKTHLEAVVPIGATLPGMYKALPRSRGAKQVLSPRFKPGEFITWKSQAGGYWKSKSGKIIGIVLKNESVAKALEAIGCAKGTYKLNANDTSVYPRYLIQVMKKRQRVNHLYAPTVSAIDFNGEPAVDETLPSFSELSGSV